MHVHAVLSLAAETVPRYIYRIQIGCGPFLEVIWNTGFPKEFQRNRVRLFCWRHTPFGMEEPASWFLWKGMFWFTKRRNENIQSKPMVSLKSEACYRASETDGSNSKTEQEVEINVTIKLISQIKTFFANINKNGSEKSNLSSQIWIKTQEDQDKFNHSQARTDQIDRFPAGLVRRCWTPLTSDEPPCLPQACHPAIRGCHL
jgi:hypothetical protein